MGVLTVDPPVVATHPSSAAESQRHVHDRDRWWVGILIACVLTFTAFPYLYGTLVSGADRVFMGVVLNVPDTAQYFSWARESQSTIWIHNKLTPEHGDAVYFNLFWFVIGRIASAIGLGIADATQLVRLFAGGAYIAGIFWFVSLVTRSRLERWTAFLVAVLGGGAGWLLVLGKFASGTLSAPLDLYVTEANTFITVMAFPHQAMAGGLLIVSLGLAALAFEWADWRPAATAGLLVFALGIQHGYDLIIVYVVVGVVGLLVAIRSGAWFRAILTASLVCGPSLPAAAYLAVLTRNDPIWRGVLAQYGNAGVYTPNLPHLFILMGLPLLLVAIGIPVAIKEHRRIRAWLRVATVPELMVWAWLVIGVGLIYLPTDFQIKMLAVWQVPVAVGSTWLLLNRFIPAMRRLSQVHGRRIDRLIAVCFVALVLPVNMYLFGWRLVDLSRREHPYFLYADEVAALQWLQSHAAPPDVVFSGLVVGEYIPSVTGANAFLAHWAETLDFYTKQRQVAAFFDPASPAAERVDLMQAYNVRYVIYGNEERALGWFDPGNSPVFQRVFADQQVSIYEVTRSTP